MLNLGSFGVKGVWGARGVSGVVRRRQVGRGATATGAKYTPTYTPPTVGSGVEPSVESSLARNTLK